MLPVRRWPNHHQPVVSFCLLIAGTFRGGNLRLNLRDFSPFTQILSKYRQGRCALPLPAGTGQLCHRLSEPDGRSLWRRRHRCHVHRDPHLSVCRLGGHRLWAGAFSRCAALTTVLSCLSGYKEGFWFCVKFCTSGPAGGGSVRLDFLAQPHRHLPQNRPSGHRIWLAGAAPASADLPAGRMDYHCQYDAANHRQNGQSFSAGDVPTVSILCARHPDSARIFRDFGRSAQASRLPTFAAFCWQFRCPSASCGKCPTSRNNEQLKITREN